MTKHFHVTKKYCAQWQLNGSQCLTHDLCAIFIGSTQHNNCTIVTVNIIKFQAALDSESLYMYNRALTCNADMEDNRDNQE